MRVGVLTSHRVPCGVAQYSERLVEALAGLDDDVEPVILAGRADEHRSVPEEWGGEVYDVAKIGLWRDDGVYELDIDAILAAGLHVVHVQYQSMLFNQQQLTELLGCYSGVKAVTYHDNCQAPNFPHLLFDQTFTHRWNVGPGCPTVIPFGIERRPFVVRTFGLGRTRSDLIAGICQQYGWTFESAASHEPIHGGGQGWRSHHELIDWLRGADAIVLWYDDVGQAGSSQAARTAMATRRPVITNDTTWFSDLPDRIAGDYYTKVRSLDDLATQLVTLASEPVYICENSWQMVARRLVDSYWQALASRTPA